MLFMRFLSNLIFPVEDAKGECEIAGLATDLDSKELAEMCTGLATEVRSIFIISRKRQPIRTDIFSADHSRFMRV